MTDDIPTMTLEEIESFREAQRSILTGVMHPTIDAICDLANLAVVRIPEQDSELNEYHDAMLKDGRRIAELEVENERLIRELRIAKECT